MTKKYLPFVFLGVALALGTMAVKATNAVQQLKVSVKGIKHVSTSLDSSRFNVVLRVFNPTSTSVGFDRLYAQVKVTGKLVAEMDIAGNGTTFRPLQETEVIVPLFIDHFSGGLTILSIIEKLKAGQPLDTPFEIVGTLYAAGFIELPLSATVRLQDFLGARRSIGQCPCFI
ncbi:MAG: hypothetical protein EOP50_00495 [Sphingobacteriales bacterium]|nr:MAG: hypothetical protein EOP50_00495 [Sphingobacteriales bacterium]